MKITGRKSLLSFVVLMAASFCLPVTAFAQFSFGNAAGRRTGVYDYHAEVNSNIEEKDIDKPEEVTRMPLFDNLPFLRLKPGDKIVKGHRWIDFMKGSKAGYSEAIEYFVLSGGKYYYLYNTKVEEKSRLFSSYDMLLFDWQFDLPSATRLYRSAESDLGSLIDIKTFPNLKAALKKEFSTSLLNTGNVTVAPPHVVEKENLQRAVFESLRFDWFADIIYFCRIEIGNGVFTKMEKPLIIGPRRVERSEFEGEDGGGINGPGSYHPDAVTAARARDAFNRMTQFQAIVNKFLVKPRTEKGGFQ